jgi:hypothetical protein
MENQITTLCGWVKLYHPRGPQATLPLPTDPKAALEALSKALELGWLAAAPGLEVGEETEEVGYVCKGEYERDGKVTPYVLLYTPNDQMKWSFLKVYLNSADDVANFEYAARVRLDDLPLYIGDNKPERGKSRQVDRYIIKATQPFKVVQKQNPKYDEHTATATKAKGEVYAVPKRVFVRWQDQRPQGATETPPAEAPAPVDSSPPPAQRPGAPASGAALLKDLERKDHWLSEKMNNPPGALLDHLRATFGTKWGRDIEKWNGDAQIHEALEESRQYKIDLEAARRNEAEKPEVPF